jgi:hypothetical protein
MGWVKDEAVGLLGPDFADVLVGREPVERFEAPSEVVGGDEVDQVSLQLLMVVVVITLHGRFLESAVHSLDLAVCPRMVRFGEPMLNAVFVAGTVEGVATPYRSRLGAVARQIGELDAVVGKDGVDLVGNGIDQSLQEAHRHRRRCAAVELGESELRGSVDRDEEIELAFRGADLGDVDVEVADGIGLEPTLVRLVALDMRQTRDAMALQATMQRRAGQVWDCRLQGI